VSITVIASLGLTMAVLFLCVMPLAGDMAGSRDFVSYWATGQQLLRHGNPYDHDAIAALEHANSLDPRAVLIMRNPPWALPIAYPLGWLGLRVAALLWSLLLAGCMGGSVMMLHRMQGSPPGFVHWIGLGFTPALICLMMGQTALFSLLGLVLFLRYHSERPFAAGAALWLCLLKPHLFLPFAAALCVWIMFSRGWRLLAGVATAVAVSTALTWIIAPKAWQDYSTLMRSPSVENDFIPCLATATRLWLWPNAVWVQYLPALLSSVWAVVFFWRQRTTWDWRKQGGTLILVSLVAAPYCWLYDQGLAIPALLQRAYSVRNRRMLTVLAALILAADVQLCLVKVISPFWLWPAPAWLLWYLLARSEQHCDAGDAAV
jgi:hypothetical protein